MREVSGLLCSTGNSIHHIVLFFFAVTLHSPHAPRTCHSGMCVRLQSCNVHSPFNSSCDIVLIKIFNTGAITYNIQQVIL